MYVYVHKCEILPCDMSWNIGFEVKKDWKVHGKNPPKKLKDHEKKM